MAGLSGTANGAPPHKAAAALNDNPNQDNVTTENDVTDAPTTTKRQPRSRGPRQDQGERRHGDCIDDPCNTVSHEGRGEPEDHADEHRNKVSNKVRNKVRNEGRGAPKSRKATTT